MDRLPAVIAGLLAAACGEPATPGKPPAERVAAVQAAESKADPAEICDVHAPAESARPFAYPALLGSAAGGKSARWINVWATWCKPCIDELPRITAWPERLRKAGGPVQLQLLAADDPAALDEWAKAHPETAGTLRMADAEALAPWLAGLGLDDSAGLPIHLFVDEADRLRCARLGGLEDEHYDAVLALTRTL